MAKPILFPISAVSSLTLRVLLAVLTALGISMVFGGRVIERRACAQIWTNAFRNDGSTEPPCQNRHNPPWRDCNFRQYFGDHATVGESNQPLRMDFDGGVGDFLARWAGQMTG